MKSNISVKLLYNLNMAAVVNIYTIKTQRKSRLNENYQTPSCNENGKNLEKPLL